MHRRQMIATLAATVAGAATGAARAVELVQPDALTLDLMREACATGRRHAAIVAEVRALLARDDLPDGVRTWLLALDCPYCGCPVDLDLALNGPGDGEAP